MSWQGAHDTLPNSHDPIVAAPLVLNLRGPEWETRLQGRIDSYTSAPATLDILSMLVRHLEAKVIVEAGTYRGWAAFTMAETVRAYEIDGHVWTCDPIDYEIQEIVDSMALTSYVTYRQQIFDDFLPTVPGDIDLAYIDASSPDEENLRLRYLGLVMPRIRIGGLVVMDDCAGGWTGAAPVRSLASLYLPLHRGLAILQKTR